MIARSLRRRALASDRRRRADDAAKVVDFPFSEVAPPHRPRDRAEPRARRSCASSASRSKAARRSCRPGVPTSTARPTSSSRSCASPGSTTRRDDARCRASAGVPKPVLTLLQKRTRLAKRALAALGLREAVTWSFISKPKRRVVRRRRAGFGARQSDRRRSLRHAAEPDPRPRRGRRAQRAARPARRRPVRGRPDLPRRRRERSAHRRRGVAARRRPRRRARAGIGRAAAARRRVRRQGRRAGAARRARRLR